MLKKWLARISFSKQSNVLVVKLPAVRFFATKPLRRYLRRRRTRTISLTQFQLSSIAMMAGAFVVGSYFTLSQVLIPMIRALTETTTQMPADVAFNRGVADILAGYDDGGGLTYVLSSEVKLATNSSWWTTDYTKKKQLTLKNLSTVSLATQSAVTQTMVVNTKALYDEGNLQENCEDLRLIFIATESGNLRSELPRTITPQAGQTCATSTATQVAFPLQEPLWSSGGTSPNYELYYGNSQATDPSYGSQGYNITREDNSTAFATLVCPFNGTTACVNQSGAVTPTTETGAIRYSGAMGGAMSFDGINDAISLGSPTSLDNMIANKAITFENWVKTDGGGSSIWGYWTATNYGGSGGGWRGIWHRDTRIPGFIIRCNTTDASVTSNVAMTVGVWHHLAITYDDTGDKLIRIYIDGVDRSSSQQACIGGLKDDSSQNKQLVMGEWGAIGARMQLDEFRISNTIRYTSNFTPQTTPFEPDEYTKLLLHFDENGDDPRNTGKAIDSSGNGNHGTITGAKYVSGLVGVDNSSSNTGAVPASTYASHGGIFIEEGTTNLITNPSFENASSATLNWGTNYFNYATASATFTPSMAKRNSAGPFATGPMVQGKLDASGNTDVLSLSTGTQISGLFKQNLDLERGSIAFWITPEWNGNDSKEHYIINAQDSGTINTNNAISIYKATDNKIYGGIAVVGGYRFVSVDVSSWTAGTTYQVTFRWDTKNTLDGSNYASISVDDAHTNGITANFSTPFTISSNLYVGSKYDGTSPANAIIEGLTIYRRPLYDGQYGIDVGNGDEINLIYNSGTGRDPTLVTGSWDVVFALPTNASTGALTTGTGNAWSHPHTSNLLYTNTTNTGGFMMNGTYTTDGFADVGTPTSVGALATGEKIFSGGYQYTSDSANEGLYRTFTATSGGDYVIRALGHSDGTCSPQVKITRADGTTEISHLNGTTTSTRTNPDVYIFTWESPAAEANQVQLINTASSGTCYWHQVEVLSNLVNNPSFESGSGDPWIPTGYSNTLAFQAGESSQDLSTKNSGSSSIKFLTAGNRLFRQSKSHILNKYYSYGVWTSGSAKNGELYVTGGCGGIMNPQFNNSDTGPNVYTTNGNTGFNFQVYRYASSGCPAFDLYVTNLANYNLDDIYSVELSDVSLTATPASQANSTEASGLRVDGADTLTQPITGLSADRGVIKFKWTPRYGISIANKFGYPDGGFNRIMLAYGGGSDYIEVNRSSTTQIVLGAYFNGVRLSANWNNPVITAGTTYNIEVSYRTGGTFSLKVDGVEVASTSMGANQFVVVPSSMNWTSNVWDATISSFVTLTPTENSTAPYYKFGSKSVKLVGYDNPDQFTTTATASANAAYTLSAYVYDGTTGNIGGTISSSSAQLASASAALSTTYTDMGGGWWRLSYTSGTQPAGTYIQGVEVKPGKTIYVDGVQLEQKGYATTYADGSLDSTGKYDWAGTAHNSTSMRTGGNVRYSSTQANNSVGTLVFWAKPNNFNWNQDFAPGNFSQSLVNIGYPIGNTGSNNLKLYWTDLDNGDPTKIGFSPVAGGIFKTRIGASTSQLPATKAWKQVIIHWSFNSGTSSDYYRLYVDGILTGEVSGQNITMGAFDDTIHIADSSNFTVSDVRIFDKALTPTEITYLYNQGLSTHSSGIEAVDRYVASGTYTSPVIDLSANGAWGATPWSASNVLGLGGVSYFTRTSPDNITWSDWVGVTGTVGEGNWTGSIESNPRRYFQWKADLSSSPDQSQTPVISNIATTYVEDSTPPVNPGSVALGYTTSASSSATLVNNEWYNYATPKFTWEAAVDDAAAGQSSSGIDGYHVLLTTDQTATPSANLANPCYRFAQSDDRVFSVGTTPSSCTLSDANYYLRLQSKDNSGNVSDPATIFTYKYDGTVPRSPASVSSTTVGYTSQNGFTFYWPSAADQGTNQSGLAYYEYKTGATEGAFSDWVKSNERGDELVTLASNVLAYQEGQNFFFVRSVDNAGNVSATTSNLGVSPFYYNASAPTAPLNLAVLPATTLTSPADENIFGVTWDKPASYSGEIAKYYYCVNCTPSASTMTETTSAETADRTLTNIALATQQGKNTLYIVAEDNNINTSTGHGNRNFEAYATAEFYAATIAPGAPSNLTIADASDRDAEVWRLTLAWKQAATGGTPAHYTIYRSTGGGAYASIGETTSTAYTDADLTQSQEYSYKVVAIDNAGSSSIASNIVTLAPEGKYTTPPLNSGSPGVTVGSTTAVITWSTGRLAFGATEYGKTTNYESSVAETVAVANHSIKLTGLTPGTLYHYRVQALDESALMGYDRENAYSSDYTFTTSATPTISDVTTTDLSLSSVVVNWSAVSLTSASIEYGESTAYGSSVVVGVGSSGTYSTKLTGLDNSTTYHFRIRAVDIDGTDITSDDYTFTTLTFPKVTAVVFKTDQAQNGTAVTLAWSTNVPTTSEVEYQAVEVDPAFKAKSDQNYDNPMVLQGLTPAELNQLPVVPKSLITDVDKADYEARHLIKVTNLTDGSLYVFTIRGRDRYGNELVSEPIRYITGADTKPPSVSNVVIETPIVGEGVQSKAEIVLSFTTDEPAFSQVIWGSGTGSEYPEATQTSKDATTEHIVVLRELKPTMSYHLKIKTTDQSGNQSETEDTIVVTPTAQQAAFELIIKNLEGVFGFLGIR